MKRLEALAGQRKRTIRFGGTGAGFDAGLSFDAPLGWTPSSGREPIGSDFESYVADGYQSNGIVFACILARLLPFTEARFQFQQMRNGRPGDLFGTDALRLLEEPWPNGTTGELLARLEQDASLAGNSYWTLAGEGARLRRLRPDWVTVISAADGYDDDPWGIEARPVAYVYAPPMRQPVLLSTDRVVHYSPIPDPLANWRGMSWLTPVLREIESDTAATEHKRKFFENGTVSNMTVTYDKSLTPKQFLEFVQMFKANHTGKDNAYKALHLGGGADAKVLGADLKSVDFKAVQGAGETRIAAAAGVGSIIARLSEGMQGSSLNAGNYSAAKRQFADMTLRPLWRTAAASLAKFVAVPAGARLWTDTRDIAFLKEDEKDASEILSMRAQAIRALIDAGFTPDAAIAAVNNNDLTLLTGEHSGLFSVQLQPAGSQPANGRAAPAPVTT